MTKGKDMNCPIFSTTGKAYRCADSCAWRTDAGCAVPVAAKALDDLANLGEIIGTMKANLLMKKES